MDCVFSQLRPSPALTRPQTWGSAPWRREAYGDPDRHQFLPIARLRRAIPREMSINFPLDNVVQVNYIIYS
jgi:hypothetical protein